MTVRNLKTLIFILVPLVMGGLCIAVIFALGLPSKFYVVVSESMIPTLRTGDAVLISSNYDTCSNFDCLKVGDIIVFEPSSQTSDSRSGKIIVHRVAAIGLDAGDQRVIRTKGDANSHSIQLVDYPITEKQYVGKVIYVIPFVGVILMYLDLLARVFVQPMLYLIIGAVAAAILLLEYQKRQNLKGNRRRYNSKGARLYRKYH
jgi:signal peptidase I